MTLRQSVAGGVQGAILDSSRLMVALLPATATAVGIVVLAQIPSPIEVAGVALVVAGVAVHRRRSS